MKLSPTQPHQSTAPAIPKPETTSKTLDAGSSAKRHEEPVGLRVAGDEGIHATLKSNLNNKAQRLEEFEAFIVNTFGLYSASECQALFDDIRNDNWRWLPTTLAPSEASKGSGVEDEVSPEDMAIAQWKAIGCAIADRIRGGQGIAKGDEGEVFLREISAVEGADSLTSDRIKAHQNLTGLNSFGVPLSEDLVMDYKTPLGDAPAPVVGKTITYDYILDVMEHWGLPVAEPKKDDMLALEINDQRISIFADQMEPKTGALYSVSEKEISINLDFFSEMSDFKEGVLATLQRDGASAEVINEKSLALDELICATIGGMLTHEASHAKQHAMFEYDDEKMDSWKGVVELAAYTQEAKAMKDFQCAKGSQLAKAGIGTLGDSPEAAHYNILFRGFNVFTSHHKERLELEKIAFPPGLGSAEMSAFMRENNGPARKSEFALSD